MLYFKRIGMKIEENVSLKDCNTLQIPVIARYLVRIQEEQDVYELIQSDLWKVEKHCILNGWANVLFTKDFDGIVLKMEMKWKAFIEDWLVEAYAWENWSDFVEWICSKWYCWVENLIDIPGNVGTAPVSNIWAYWVEISKYVKYVEGVNLQTWEKKIYNHEDCEFAYRTSIFKHSLKENFLIIKVEFSLNRVDETYVPNIGYADIQKQISESWNSPTTPIEVLNIVRDIRANKLPDWHKIWTAGSFFANPIVTKVERLKLEKQFPNLSHHDYLEWTEMKIKLSAGQLIDLCGLKWWRIKNGMAGTYEKHALILINDWGNADDVLEAMHYIQKMVLDKFGVRLEPEVVLV